MRRKGTHKGYPYETESMPIVGATLVVALAGAQRPLLRRSGDCIVAPAGSARDG